MDCGAVVQMADEDGHLGFAQCFFSLHSVLLLLLFSTIPIPIISQYLCSKRQQMCMNTVFLSLPTNVNLECAWSSLLGQFILMLPICKWEELCNYHGNKAF